MDKYEQFLLEKLKEYRELDIHIGSKDDLPSIRMKDMYYAKLLAYEEMYNKLQEYKQQ